MSKTRSQQVITLENLLPLKNNSSSNSNSTGSPKKSIIWKDFGVYLDKKIDSHLNRDTDQISSITYNSSLNSSYLSLVNKYRICSSCSRPIGVDSLETHYSRCIEMKQKKKDLEAAAAASGTSTSAAGSQGKRKRGRNALLDVDQSSVESSRNTTPLPTTPAQPQAAANSGTVGPDGVVKPKKKYKKSKTQREKEAANAAAAAAAAALAANNKLSSSKKDRGGDGGNSLSQSNLDGNYGASGLDSSGTSKKTKVKSQAKLKGPVDVEKQCGVPLPSGGFCARSLTCKTHSMGAKRAVLGRSAPYDVLLQQYQKRNQAKLAANNALAAQRRENAAFTGGVHGLNSRGEGFDLDAMSNQMVNKVLDPDEETHLVLEGLSKNNPAPLERKVIMPVRNRHRFLYMREAYANALITLGGSSASASGLGNDQTLANQAISGSIGGLQGRCTLVNVDQSLGYVAPDPNVPYSTQALASISGELYQVRAPLKAILLTSQHNTMQQQAFQQQLMKHQQQMLLLKQRQAQQQQQQQQQKQQQQQQQQVQPQLLQYSNAQLVQR